MDRNLLMGKHGFLHRRDVPMNGIRDALLAAFIIVVIAVTVAGYFG